MIEVQCLGPLNGPIGLRTKFKTDNSNTVVSFNLQSHKFRFEYDYKLQGLGVEVFFGEWLRNSLS